MMPDQLREGLFDAVSNTIPITNVDGSAMVKVTDLIGVIDTLTLTVRDAVEMLGRNEYTFGMTKVQGLYVEIGSAIQDIAELETL